MKLSIINCMLWELLQANGTFLLSKNATKEVVIYMMGKILRGVIPFN